ncbi:sirohydrochlorin chelatase [Streptacidiphilus sp. EB103A]|uniref:sirohydrochlorin chelatase n=1 Tax=Streptacidiphilus sp. EB103A TaxID=3156275 RepID=UPI0035193C78
MTPTDSTPDEGPLGSSHAELIAEIAHRFTPRPSDPHRHLRALPSRSPRRSARPVLVAVAHGSRDPAALATALRLLDQVRAQRPGLDVRLAHLDLNEPRLDEVLGDLPRSGRSDVVLVPLLLGRGFHVRVDIPEQLARHPHLDAAVAPPLGPHPLLAEALQVRLAEAGWDEPETVRLRRREARDAVVLAASGSRDPASVKDAQTQALLLAARLHVPVVPAFVSAAAPTVTQAVAALCARGYRRIAVSSYFTAPGDFARLAAGAAPWLVAAPLGAQEAMAALVLERFDRAAAGDRVMAAAQAV